MAMCGPSSCSWASRSSRRAAPSRRQGSVGLIGGTSGAQGYGVCGMNIMTIADTAECDTRREVDTVPVSGLPARPWWICARSGVQRCLHRDLTSQWPGRTVPRYSTLDARSRGSCRRRRVGPRPVAAGTLFGSTWRSRLWYRPESAAALNGTVGHCLSPNASKRLTEAWPSARVRQVLPSHRPRVLVRAA